MLTVFITLIESILLFIFTILLLRYYASRDSTPLYVKILTVFGWFLGLIIILLIPLDILIVKTFILNFPNLI